MKWLKDRTMYRFAMVGVLFGILLLIRRGMAGIHAGRPALYALGIYVDPARPASVSSPEVP